MEDSCKKSHRESWNKGKWVDQKAPFKLKDPCSTWSSTVSCGLAIWSSSRFATSAMVIESRRAPSSCSRRPPGRCRSRLQGQPTKAARPRVEMWHGGFHREAASDCRLVASSRCLFTAHTPSKLCFQEKAFRRVAVGISPKKTQRLRLGQNVT